MLLLLFTCLRLKSSPIKWVPNMFLKCYFLLLFIFISNVTDWLFATGP